MPEPRAASSAARHGAIGRALLACALLVAASTPAGAVDDPFSTRSRHPVGQAAPQRAAEGRCGEPRGVSLYAFPEHPIVGSPVSFVAVSETPREAKLIIDSPSGQRLAVSSQRRGGPPYSWMVVVSAMEAGSYQARLAIAGDSALCIQSEVDAEGPPPRPRSSSSLWPIERVWDRDTENLYSVWIEKLFDDPLDANPTWKSLHEVTRDPARNFLRDSLGLGEDTEGGITLEPDCADLPYFLRAYFAWKLRLPFVYSRCYATSQDRAPVCTEQKSNLENSPAGKETLAVLQRFFARSVADSAHSATGRTAAMDDRTDVYPIRIGTDTLRPGTVYIDPYGHVLVVAKRLDQTRTTSGILFAVDAQPDGTVARKRYWRGNFLFNVSPDGSAAGFKRFRPVVPVGDSVRTLNNAEILGHPGYRDWSNEQYEGDADYFYDLVDAALSPYKRSARQVLLEVVDSLEQQVIQRVASVDGGEQYMARASGVMAMPSGAAIFQTIGPWEDYATPSRDMRLLIAIDVVRGFPGSVVRRPERFLLEKGRSLSQVRADLEDLLSMELERRTFQYMRSNGTPWTLKLSEVIERAVALEMAYNPNDCIETRWGAPPDSIEAQTCRRQSPPDQLRKMRDVRDWFETRTRPAT